jgi:hypothetical protein
MTFTRRSGMALLEGAGLAFGVFLFDHFLNNDKIGQELYVFTGLVYAWGHATGSKWGWAKAQPDQIHVERPLDQ